MCEEVGGGRGGGREVDAERGGLGGEMVGRGEGAMVGGGEGRPRRGGRARRLLGRETRPGEVFGRGGLDGET